jgi:hypothetical protein
MRKRFTPATVLAMVALFVALAGSATAGTALITGAQIKNGSIGLLDLSANAKRALKGQRGPQGYQGPQGAPGVAGVPGAAGAAGGFDPAKVSYVTGPTVTFAPDQIAHADASCPAGTAVIGGGYYASIAHVAADKTYGDGRTWSVLIHNDSSISIQVNAHAVCAAR